MEHDVPPNYLVCMVSGEKIEEMEMTSVSVVDFRNMKEQLGKFE